MRLTRPLTNEEISFYNNRNYAIKIDVGTLDIENKLGQFEDIEDEFKLNIKMVRVLLLAFQDGFYGYCEDDDHEKPYIFQFWPGCFMVDYEYKEITVFWENSDQVYCVFHFKDYGKKWALTEEELEA